MSFDLTRHVDASLPRGSQVIFELCEKGSSMDFDPYTIKDWLIRGASFIGILSAAAGILFALKRRTIKSNVNVSRIINLFTCINGQFETSEGEPLSFDDVIEKYGLTASQRS